MRERSHNSGSSIAARLAKAELPRRPVGRWSPQLKFRIVCAVDGGTIALSDVCQHYGISLTEYLEWQHGVHSWGFRGLVMRERQHNPVEPAEVVGAPGTE